MHDTIKHIALGIMVLLCSCTHRFDEPTTNSPLGNFEALWNIIDQKYCFLDEKQIDWDAVYLTYYAQFDTLQIRTYEDNYRFFDLMEEVVNTLNDGHVNLYSSFDISVCRSWYEGYPANFDIDIITQYYLKDYRQAGGLNYCRIDNDSIGYIYYNSFSNTFSQANWLAVLRYFNQCKGIVIDVRNNGGGTLTNAYLLAAPFFTQDTIVGYWQHKTGPQHNDFSELKPMLMEQSTGYWKRPVVVLCNRHTYSAANFFVSIMRYANNAHIVGSTSGGGGGMPMSYELPCGWLLRFSSIKMYDREMNSIEPGIRPHIIINQQSSDKDDLIEQAITTIHTAYP